MIYVDGLLPTISNFPNGETMVKLPKSVEQKDEHPNNGHIVEWFFENDSEFMQIQQINSILNNKVFCSIPYFPYERMDRRETNNPLSLKCAVQMLPKNWEYQVVEPHSEVLQEIFKENELDLKIDFFNDFMSGSAWVRVLPDKGSVKRYLGNPTLKEEVIEDITEGETIYLVGGKERDFDTHKINDYVVNKQLVFNDEIQDLEIVDWNKQEVIEKLKSLDSEFGECSEIEVIDDVVSYGNTFIKLADYLKKELYSEEFSIAFVLSVAHAETAILKGDLLDSYDLVSTTNSLLHGVTNNKIYITEMNKL